MVTYRYLLQKSLPNSKVRTTTCVSVYDLPLEGQLFGTFTAQQVHPPGPLHTFVVQQCGLKFIQ